MLEMNDVLDRLMKGESAEDIAAELTDVLNAAIDQKRKHDAAEAETRRLEANAKAAKEAALRKMFEGAREFAVCVGCEDLFSDDEDIEGMITNEAIVQELTDMMKTLQPVMALINQLDELGVDEDPCDDDCCMCMNPDNKAFVVKDKKSLYNEPTAKMKCGKPGSASVEATMTDRDIVNDFIKMFS
jgi:hypothetical protein